MLRESGGLDFYYNQQLQQAVEAEDLHCPIVDIANDFDYVYFK